jgi:hypothetical protein
MILFLWFPLGVVAAFVTATILSAIWRPLGISLFVLELVWVIVAKEWLASIRCDECGAALRGTRVGFFFGLPTTPRRCPRFGRGL